MKAEQFIKNLQQNGVELHIIEGNALKVRYDNDTLSQNDIERIRQHKAEIISLLSKKKPTTRARGYGCVNCGNKIYQAVNSWEMSELPAGSPWSHEHRPIIAWQCEQCEAVDEIVNGSLEPHSLY